MAIRVTQNTMYDKMTSQMQKSLAAYMESNEQGSSQKKINRPSDDPAGTYRVLVTRNDISATTQYQSNVDTAKGWLSLADNVLGTQLSNSLTSLKALAEQAATGTYSAENRKQIADHIEHARVSCRVRAGRAADGLLVDANDLIDKLQPLYPIALSGPAAGSVQLTGQRLVQNLVDEAGFA